MRKRLSLSFAAAAAALTIAACGGDDESSDEYVAQLDDACQTFQRNLERVPVVADKEGLSLDESRDLGVQYADEFEAAVEGLEAPSDLSDTAETLQETIANPPPSDNPDPQAFLDYYEELRSLYEEIGASGCEEIQTEAIATLEEIQKGGLFESGVPPG
jgi:hypothetical protein